MAPSWNLLNGMVYAFNASATQRSKSSFSAPEKFCIPCRMALSLNIKVCRMPSPSSA
jgi:hypothetical protein